MPDADAGLTDVKGRRLTTCDPLNRRNTGSVYRDVGVCVHNFFSSFRPCDYRKSLSLQKRLDLLIVIAIGPLLVPAPEHDVADNDAAARCRGYEQRQNENSL